MHRPLHFRSRICLSWKQVPELPGHETTPLAHAESIQLKSEWDSWWRTRKQQQLPATPRIERAVDQP